MRHTVTVLGAALCMATAMAQPVPEMVMKATYLFNFMRYVEWPPVSGAPASDTRAKLCVYGVDPFGPALSPMDGKLLGDGRAVSVVRTRSLTNLTDCQLLYVTDDEAANMPKVLDAVKGVAVLVVSESPLARGDAAILLSVQQNKLVFDVNLRRAKAAELRISSKLLQLARAVEN